MTEASRFQGRDRPTLGYIVLTALMLLVLLYGLWTFWLFARKVGDLFPGILVGYERHLGHYVVGSMTPGNWPALQAQGGLQKGDIIFTIDGRWPENYWQIYLDAARSGASSLTLALERGGRRWEAELPLVPFGWQEFGEAKLPSFVLGLALWLLGFAVYQANPRASQNRVFGIGMVAASSLSLGLFTSEFFSRQGEALVSLPIFGSAFPLMGACIGHFATIFPVQEPASRLYRCRILWYVSAVPLIVAMSYPYAYEATHGGYATPEIRSLAAGAMRTIMIYLALVVLFALARYTVLYRTRHTARIRQQIMTLAWGFGLGILLPLLTFFFQGLSTLWDPTIYQYATLIFGLVAAYTIMRYELFALPQNWAVSFTVGLLAILLAYAFILCLSLILGWRIDPLPVLAAVVVTSFFWRFDTPLRRPLARFLFPKTYLYDVLNVIYQAVAASDLEQWPGIILLVLQQKLHLTYAALWQAKKSAIANRLQLVVLAGEPPPELEVGSCIDARALQEIPAADWLAIRWQGQVIGYLSLGAKETGEVPHEQEKELRNIVAQQLALVLTTLDQMEDLRQVPRRITQAQEAERKRIAADLHDAVQSRLTGLKFTLASLARQVTPNSRAAELVATGRAALQETAEELTAIRSNLTPEIVAARGLVAALEGLVQRVRTRHEVQIELLAEEGVDHCLDRAAQTEVYRVFQQAVHNALIHAGATHIELRLHQKGDHLVFEIADDGCGMPPPSLPDLVAEGHYGLQSMLDRVSLLGGTLLFASGPAGGTVVRGEIPV